MDEKNQTRWLCARVLFHSRAPYIKTSQRAEQKEKKN